MPDPITPPPASGSTADLKTGAELANHQPSLFQGSGMYQSMKDFLPKEDEQKPSQSSSQSGGEPPANPLEGDLDALEKPALIEEVKKNQRFVTERDTKITEMTTKLAELEAKAQSGGDPELAQIFKELAVDFKGTYDRIQKKYGLPDSELVVKQFTGGDITSRIKQWQDSHLRSEIEKKHGLAEGEFEYDPKDAEIAGTASWDWKDLTDKKRKEFSDAEVSARTTQEKNLEKLNNQQLEDKKWIAQQYYDNKLEDVEALVTSMNETVAKISRGELTPENHPLAMRNIIRGFKHEELVAKAVKTATDNLMAEFAKHKLYLPDQSKLPTDLSQMKGSGKGEDVSEFSKKALAVSPMLRSLQI